MSDNVEALVVEMAEVHLNVSAAMIRNAVTVLEQAGVTPSRRNVSTLLRRVAASMLGTALEKQSKDPSYLGNIAHLFTAKDDSP